MENEIIAAMKERRSCRSYKPDMVEPELIDAVAEAGLWAASGVGLQDPVIIKVTDKTLRDKLSAANNSFGPWDEGFDPFYGAPVVLVVVAPKNCFTYLYDGSLVMGNMMLAAHALGLGSCWIHRAKEVFELPEYQELLKSLGLEGEYEGIGNCILGYPEKVAEPKPRREGRYLSADGC